MFQRILIATDGSPSSQSALEMAVRLAKEQHSALRIIHVIDVAIGYVGIEYSLYRPDIESDIRNAGKHILDEAERYAKDQQQKCEAELLEAGGERVAKVIIHDVVNWRADLLVIGAHGRGVVDRLILGSVSDRIVKTVDIPILLIKK